MLKRTFTSGLLVGTILAASGLSAFAQEAFDGPTTGPKAAEGKTIVVLAGDMKNGGILGVTTGIEEAAAKIGWTVKQVRCKAGRRPWDRPLRLARMAS